MRIRLGYGIGFDNPAAVAMVHVHSSRAGSLRKPDLLRADPPVPIDLYTDSFGSVCSRFVAPAGGIRLHNLTPIEDSGVPDQIAPDAIQVPEEKLPHEVLEYLLASRYCEGDLFSPVAAEWFGHTQPGWERVQAICDWVQQKVAFGYEFARPTRTALDVYTERAGVCRDFQHLAIAFCRALNIPARYATSYLKDIGVPVVGAMNFSAFFQAYLTDRWWAFDARFHVPRIGRVLIAVGRDAADVAITTAFGAAPLRSFQLIADEVPGGD